MEGTLENRLPRVKIIGVGGAGGNAVDRLRLESSFSVELAVVNTDAQALASSPVDEALMIGSEVTRGLSAGGDPEIGRQAAEQDAAALKAMLQGMDMVIILAGLGGGTGSGAAPVLARFAAEQDALVVAFVTRPFSLEGQRRQSHADEAIASLRPFCDAVVPLPNDLLLQYMEESATVLDAFAQADLWISRGVRSLCAMLFKTGLINLDFAMLRTAFCRGGGKTLFGLGRGEGAECVQEALADLEICPLLHTPDFTRQADRLLVNIIGGADLGIAQVNEILGAVTRRFGGSQDTVLGAVIDEGLHQQLEVCVLGTTDLSGHRYATPQSERPRQVAEAASEAPTQVDVAAPKADAGEVLPAPPNARPGKGKDRKKQKVHSSKLGGRHQNSGQEELSLFGAEDDRGVFVRTTPNFFDGQDLDVPTYLRQGIRVVL